MPYINTFLLFIMGTAVTVILHRQNASKIDREKAETRIRGLEDRLAQAEFRVTPLWEKVQQQLVDDLHHPHSKHLETDLLLEKLNALTINNLERDRLKELLVERSVDPTVSEAEKKSAELMIYVMERVLLEATVAPTEVSLVAITPSITAPPSSES